MASYHLSAFTPLPWTLSLFTPTPRFADFSSLNQWLETRCHELAGRRHPTQEASIADVLQLERPHLRPVTMPFDGYVEQLLRKRPARPPSQTA
ncbi:hypothetical protein ACFSQE_16070 [Vogesella fluminis]|uniref:hypothetical protein n=1 Tax=Vogesella fluminis TaxID=1069161 RepID=UPI00362F0387